MTASELRNLRILIASSVVSKAADYCLMLVVPLAVLATTGSAASAIFTFALRGVAYATSPLIGSLIDRFDRRSVYFTAQVGQAACVAVATAFLDRPPMVALALLVSGFGAVATSITGQFVLVPQLISADSRPQAVARLASAIEFAKIGGFLLGGLALSAAPPRFSAALVALLYSVAAAVSLALPRTTVTRTGKTAVRKDLRIGFQWLAKPAIGWLVASMAVSNLALGGLEAVLVTTMGRGGVSPAVTSGTLAAGLFIGALGARATPRILVGQGMRARILVFQMLAGLGLALIALDLPTPVMIFAYGGLCFALGLSNVASISFRQETIPVELAGRVNSVIRMFIAGAIPVSGMIYAAAESRGLWVWLPALILQSLSLIIWATFMVRSRRRTDAAVTS